MTSLAAIAAVLVLALSGCGGDDNTASSPGAPDGATGNAAGGAAPEAGKIRSEKDKENEAKNFSKEPPPIQIQSGNVSGVKVSKPTAIVVQSTPEMRKLKKRVYAKKGSNPSTWTATDFKTRQFVGVFMPPSKPGSLIAITDIYQNGDEIQVKVTQLTRGKGCKAGKDKPNPWQVVETRKMEGKPVVVLSTQPASPC